MAYHMMILVPSYQKVPKVKIACSYSKEGDLYWLEDSPLTWPESRCCWLQELRNLQKQVCDCRIKDVI